ncbi:hypothetical protein [Streptomyces sp. I05A-00742]|uniref:hypothetical protein n=1 Tax=Streptomyces sp. I05A-00742 TaxID=2732853 RepID=UPI001489EB3C|nr:hypothetical protein [Streptomyces sp. I05A-00742]
MKMTEAIEIDYSRFQERLEAAGNARDTTERWALLREFQEEWGYEPTGGARWERDEPDAHKEYVAGLASPDAEPEDVDRSLPIPAALDEWWDLPFNSFADRCELYWTNPVRPPTVRPDPTGYGIADGLPPGNPFVGPDEDPRVCVLMAENQYCNEWGYPAARAHLADPPVLVTVADGEWVLQSRSVSEFFLHLAAARLPAHYGWTVEDPALSPEAMTRLRRTLRPMGLLPWRELGSHTEFLGGPDVIACHNTGYGDTELVVYGRTEEALRRLADTLGTDWSAEITEPESHHEEP